MSLDGRRRATRGQMTLPRRLLACGLAVAAAHEVLAGVSLWALGVPQLASWFGLSGAITAGTALLGYRVVMRRRGEGGGGPHRPDAPAPDPPPWSPAFEREFWAHVRACPPGGGKPSQAACPGLTSVRREP
jgi:hypothetical protein